MKIYEIVGSSETVVVSGCTSRLENAALGYVGRLNPRLDRPKLPPDTMTVWSRFLDWLFGVRLMSMEDLEELEGRTIDVISGRFERLNERIDVNEDGQVSVREAWALVKSMVGSIREIMGGMLR